MPAEAVHQPEGDEALPKFHLTALDVGDEDDEGVEITAATPANPSVRRHASLALLYGLAIMTLDQDGTIEARMDVLLTDGPISEVDAVNRINLLLLKDANVQSV